MIFNGNAKSHFSIRGLCQEYDTVVTLEPSGEDIHLRANREWFSLFSFIFNTHQNYTSRILRLCKHSRTVQLYFVSFQTQVLSILCCARTHLQEEKQQMWVSAGMTPQSSVKSGFLWSLSHKTCLGKTWKCFSIPQNSVSPAGLTADCKLLTHCSVSIMQMIFLLMGISFTFFPRRNLWAWVCIYVRIREWLCSTETF